MTRINGGALLPRPQPCLTTPRRTIARRATPDRTLADLTLARHAEPKHAIPRSKDNTRSARGRFSASRWTIFIAISALSLALTGCIASHSTDAAIKACTDHGGAPTVGRWGEVTDCKFPPEKGAAVK